MVIKINDMKKIKYILVTPILCLLMIFSCQEADVLVPTSGNEVTALSIMLPDGEKINADLKSSVNNIINVEVEGTVSTDLSKLTMSLSIPNNATIESDVPMGTYMDFTKPVNFDVISATGEKRTYTVNINLKVIAPEMDKLNWEVIDWNSSMSDDEEYINLGNTPDKMIDGDEMTRWSAKWNTPLTPLPYYFIIDMKEEKTITKFGLVAPIKIAPWRGLYKSGYFEVSKDNKTWVRAINWTLSKSPGYDVFELNENVEGRYIKLVLTEGLEYGDGNPGEGPAAGTRMEIAELRVWGY